MKIIFLDIDGVLNSTTYYTNLFKVNILPDDRLDPKAIDLFNKIVDATGANIVVSSSWRIGKSIDDLQSIFDSHNIHGKIIGKTPDNSHCRGRQIQRWIIMMEELIHSSL